MEARTFNIIIFAGVALMFLLFALPFAHASPYSSLAPASVYSTLKIPNGTVAQMEALTPALGMIFEETDADDTTD